MPQGNPEAYNQPMPQQPAGPQPVADTGFNQDVQNILWSRVQNLLNEADLMAMDKIITPETLPTLIKLFPEMQILFEQATAIRGQAQGPIQGAQPVQDTNPLLNPNVSRGLVG